MRARIAAVPYVVWAAIFIIVPLVLVCIFAFSDGSGHFSMENISSSFGFAPVICNSIWLSIIATALCLVIAYPLAYWISRSSVMVQRTFILLIMLPMWMNFLICTYAWMTILGRIGLLNTQFAVVLGMVYNYLPYMILPLYSVMVKIDHSLVEAAQDLGCDGKEILYRVILPLSSPGISTGIIMVFVPSVSTFVISRMLGGGSFMLIGDLIEMEFLGNAYNPALGAAISMVLMVIILVVMALTDLFHDPEEKEGLLI